MQWLAGNETDVLLLQETKVTDEDFPLQALEGSQLHAIYRGQKTYNGVAILSRQALKTPDISLPEILDREKRICMAESQGILLVNVYVPNGSEVGSEKYAFKLQWLETFTQLIAELLPVYPKMLIAGDFNITPADEDVYNPKAWHEKILCSSAERAVLQKLMGYGFDDSFRRHNQEPEQYSWWDYRAAAFNRNRGLRIDLMLTSVALRDSLMAASIDKTPRAWERPSDHAPVSVTLSDQKTQK